MKFDRRQFFATALGAAAYCALPARPTLGAAAGRELAFRNLHTNEFLAATYWSGGNYLPDACSEIDRLLRDHRTGEIAPISTKLLDLIFELRGRLGTDAPVEVISGYRSPKTNAVLARAHDGVARRSLHMRGMAIDIRVPGCPLKKLRSTALGMRAGGVGYYPKSRFVHIDIGRVRYW